MIFCSLKIIGVLPTIDHGLDKGAGRRSRITNGIVKLLITFADVSGKCYFKVPSSGSSRDSKIRPCLSAFVRRPLSYAVLAPKDCLLFITPTDKVASKSPRSSPRMP